MRVLYISEDYPYSKVHHELCKHIVEGEDIRMTLYSVIRSGIKNRDLRALYNNINYKTLFYELDVNEWRYKVDFYYKIQKKYDWLVQHDLSDVTMVHAATLFSEGAVALKLYKEKGIPYIVAVRGTDINFYFKYMFHLWNLGTEILQCAKDVIFLTDKSCEVLLYNKGVKKIKDILNAKKHILPNGIDNFWIKNAQQCKRNLIPYRLLYIGMFDKNKNIISLLHVILELRNLYPELQLSLVGGGGDCHEKVLEYCYKYPTIFEYKGKIYEKEILCKLIREHDIFTMVSHSETFGLVYLEALSQGLPILYTKGQGIDGVFIDNVGEGVNSHDVNDIFAGLQKIIENYTSYYWNRNIVKYFSWPSIASLYRAIYLK